MPGFNSDLVERNAYLESRGVKSPSLTKTGTTIAGIVFKVRDWQDSQLQGSTESSLQPCV